ncbi:MAG: hypothetical protein M1381_03210 [Deltaproteobacteria bacterium]|nr:hypothetical protein [Deltaproteobacteria bacterium]
MFLKNNKPTDKVRLVKIALASLYLSIIIFLPFLHNHPLVLGQPEPANCPEHAFVIASYGVVNHVMPIVISFFSFIYNIPVRLIRIKYTALSAISERAPPAFVS